MYLDDLSHYSNGGQIDLERRERLIDGLSGQAKKWINDGIPIPGKENSRHSGFDYRDACDASILAEGIIHDRWSYDDFVLVMANRDDVGIEANKFAQLEDERDGKGYAYLRRTFKNVSRKLLDSPAFADRDDVRNRLLAFLFTIQHAKWPGQSGSNDLALLESHIEIAMRRPGLDYGASNRELAVLTNVDRKSISPGNLNLAKRDVFTRLNGHSQAETSRYRLNLELDVVEFPIPDLRGMKEWGTLRPWAAWATMHGRKRHWAKPVAGFTASCSLRKP